MGLLDHKTKIVVFGANKEGQLIADKESIQDPTFVKIEADCIQDVVFGVQHSLYLLCNGTMLCAGNNEKLQFGRGSIKSNFEKVSGIKDDKVVKVAAGPYFSAAVSQKGRLYSWGHNKNNQLGRGISESIGKIGIVESLSKFKIIQVACGMGHCIALTNDSALFAWGANDQGQLGLGYSGEGDIKVPHIITSLNALPVWKISAGYHHTVCISTSGSVFTWGINNKCQLGIGSNGKELAFSSNPMHIRAIKAISIVYVSCGSNHTALLTKDGGVFTFGDGSYGQLGQGNFDNQCSPRIVPDLMGSTIIQVTCGENYTLALSSESMSVYGFGQSKNGELGGIFSNTDIPKKIQVLPTIDDNNSKSNNKSESKIKKVRKLCAGTAQNIILLIDEKNTICEDFRKPPNATLYEIDRFTSSLYASLQKSKKPISDDIKVVIFSVMGSLGSMATSFLDEREENNHFLKTKLHHGIDIELSVKCQQLIASGLSEDELQALCVHIYENALSLQQDRKNYPAIECLRAFLNLLLCPLLDNLKYYEFITAPLYTCINNLMDVPASVLEAWITKLQPRHFRRIIETAGNLVKYHISILPPGKSNEIPPVSVFQMKAALDFMKFCFSANEKVRIVPYTCFYVPNLNDKIDIERNFLEWASTNMNSRTGPFSLCAYPFVFDGKAKARLLQVEANLFMRNAILETHTNLLMSIIAAAQDPNNNDRNDGLITMENPFFVIGVNRETILEDTLKVLHDANVKDFKKPLKISFSNEEAVDDGGVVKEFFLLVIREIMLPERGLFKCNAESNMCYFHQNITNKNSIYRCVGQLCGLAIYNGVIVDLHFPLALFKKLLNELPDIEDLIELDPTLGKSLQSLLDYSDSDSDFKETFQLYHEIIWEDVNGVSHQHEQFTNGANVPVTLETREQYVLDYIGFIMNENVATSFESFKNGFYLVAIGSVIKLFRPIELQEMVVGSEITDWVGLQKNTRYEGEYWEGHQVIKWFWEIFKQLSENDKKHFLRFLTGCDRIPVTGMKDFKIVIQSTNGGDAFFPVAHTCFNLLDLPKYTTKSILKKQLMVCIGNSEGFGLV